MTLFSALAPLRRNRLRNSRRLLAGTTALIAAVGLAAPALAAPSTNATANLIQLLIKNKVITKEAGEALLQQAEAEAAEARAALAKSGAAGAAGGAAVAGVAAPPPGTIRVPYVSDATKAQIAAEVKKDVMAQAQTEGWATPNQVPSWVQRFKLYGDFRMRSDSVFYSNNNTQEFIDFETFNRLSPIDINPNTNPTGFPYLNTLQDQTNVLRVRARLGFKVAISDVTMVAFRLATGDNNGPVSTNTILGGGFEKKDVWVDQAYAKFTPAPWGEGIVGRFGNPFSNSGQLFDTAELVFDNDVNFDGIALTGRADQWLPDNIKASLILGAFPLGYANPEFPVFNPVKSDIGNSKWLYSAMLRGEYGFDGGISVEAKIGYHSFDKVQGQLSEPCALFNGNTQCSTDQFQPTFLQKGNTLFFLRDIAPDPASPLNFAQPQLLGLAFDYDVLQIGATVKFPVREGIDVLLTGEYTNNVGFDKNDLCRYNPLGLPINNINAVDPIAGSPPGTEGSQFYTNPCTPDSAGRLADFEGGNQGFLIRTVIGVPEPKKWGDWNVELAYRYIESDATLDSLTDSDFHRGGTNAKGYSIAGALGITDNVTVVARWISSNEVSGPPLAIDVLYLDLLAEF